MPAECPGQDRYQRHQRIGQGCQRTGQALMPLGDPFRDIARCREARVQQLPYRYFRHIRWALIPGAHLIDQVNLIFGECQHVQTPGLAVNFLAAAVDQQNPRAAHAFQQLAGFRQNRGMHRRVAGVINHDPVQRPIRHARADVYDELIGNGCENAFLQQKRGDLVADLPLKLLERRECRRHRDKIKPVSGHHRQHRQCQCRAGQSERRQAGRSHDGDFPIAGQPLIDELDHHVGGNGQYDRDKAGDQQPGQAHEYHHGETAVHHKLDKSQRLRQPDQRGEPKRYRDQGPEELTEHISIEPRGDGAQTHAMLLRHPAE